MSSGSSQSPEATRTSAARAPTASRAPAGTGAAEPGAEPVAGLLHRPADQDFVAERQPEQAGGGQDQDQPGVAEVTARGRPRPAPRISPAADRGARPERRRQLVDGRGGHDHDHREPDRRARPVRQGPASRQQQIDHQQRRRQQPARPADRREHRVGQRGARPGRKDWSGSHWPARRHDPEDRPGHSRPDSLPGRRSPGRTRRAVRIARLGAATTFNPPVETGRGSGSSSACRVGETHRRGVHRWVSPTLRSPVTLPSLRRTSHDRLGEPEVFRIPGPGRGGLEKGLSFLTVA